MLSIARKPLVYSNKFPTYFTFYPLKLELQNQSNEGGTYESTTNDNRINRDSV